VIRDDKPARMIDDALRARAREAVRQLLEDTVPSDQA
jgi:hypothetical protein